MILVNSKWLEMRLSKHLTEVFSSSDFESIGSVLRVESPGLTHLTFEVSLLFSSENEAPRELIVFFRVIP
jgi:hypothetical protein